MFYYEAVTVRFPQVTDGLSNTIMMGEITFRDGNTPQQAGRTRLEWQLVWKLASGQQHAARRRTFCRFSGRPSGP